MKHSKILLVAMLFLLPNIIFARTIVLDSEDTVLGYLKNNPQIVASQIDVDIAKNDMQSTFSSMLPSFMLKLEYSYLTTAMQIATPMGLMNMGSNENYSITTGFNWTIFAGGRIHTAYKISKYKKDITELQSVMTEAETRKQSLTMYYSVLLQQEYKGFLEDTRNTLEENENTLEEMVKSGLATETDLQRVKSSKASVEASLMEIKANIEKVEDMLKIMLSLNDDDTLVITGNMPIKDPKDFDGDNLNAVKIMKKGEDIVKLTKKIAIGSLLPVINVGIMYKGNNLELQTGTQWYDTYVYYANFNLPLNLIKSIADYKKANNQIKKTRIENDYRKKALIKTIESIQRNITNKKEVLKARQLAKEAAYMALESAKEQYEKGVISHIDYLKAQMDYKNTCLDYVQAEFAYIQEILNLEEITYNK